jgi:amphi-Trp domain-containing protein
MSSINEFKHESLQDCNSIADYLKVITEGFQNGELMFRNDKEQILLRPDGMIQMEVKARKKDKKVKLSVKLYWKESLSASDNDDYLVIDSNL